MVKGQLWLERMYDNLTEILEELEYLESMNELDDILSSCVKRLRKQVDRLGENLE